jgi:asparagine synthase (glutamine-hydrolysing)
MTVFAGVFCMSPEVRAPQELKNGLSLNVSRAGKNTGQWKTHDSTRLFLTKWDSGAFDEPAWRTDSDGAICALAGDPLLTDNGQRLPRHQQLRHLAPEAEAPHDKAFAQCRGSFAFVHYSAVREELHIATDAVGLRSVYYTIQDGLLVFSTALRVLEAIPAIRKNLSTLGMAELRY